MPPLPADALIASYWTICGGGPGRSSPWSIAERAAAAARVGYRGIGLRNDDYVAAREAGVSDADLRQVLADNGIVVAEIEFVSGWSSDDAEVRARARKVEDDLYALAEALANAPNVNVGCSEPVEAPAPLERVVERFAALCDRAAVHGLPVALEFMPWTGIPDAATAWEIVSKAGRVNGGVLVDAWHYFRGAADPAQVRAIPAERIVGLQINDALAEAVGTLREDTLHRRKLPGEGVFDLTSLVRLLDEMGVTAPWAVEVISDDQFALPLDVAARRSFETTLGVLEKARKSI
ncbi:MAG TPA: sugar phosphate isomerase/epimerase family protein [Dehalococcoidia bacterium]|nr:sugar phosphate isomerase/epimerase family protein [Dehalococcoidia bacterium]